MSCSRVHAKCLTGITAARTAPVAWCFNTLSTVLGGSLFEAVVNRCEPILDGIRDVDVALFASGTDVQ